MEKSELFYDFASIDYPIVDADAHVQEPPDLWQSPERAMPPTAVAVSRRLPTEPPRLTGASHCFWQGAYHRAYELDLFPVT